MQDFHLISLDTFIKYRYSDIINGDTTVTRLLKLYPQLAGIISDINEYISRPWEVLNMFSEALRILDKNSMDLLIDEMKQEMDTQKKEITAQIAENNELQAEIARLKAENAQLKNKNQNN